MLQDILQGIKNLVFPRHCLICRRWIEDAKTRICEPCHQSLPTIKPPLCLKCSRHLLATNTQGICSTCQHHQYAFDRAFGCYDYKAPITELIKAFKFQHKDYLSSMFVDLMIEHINQCHFPIEEFDAIIPIPLNTERLRERGYNQSFLLAQGLSKHFNIPLLPNTLIRQGSQLSQTQLNANNRWTNLQGAFKMNTSLNLYRKILLIDDVLTTGATTHAASLTLKEHGANNICVLTFAITP